MIIDSPPVYIYINVKMKKERKHSQYLKTKNIRLWDAHILDPINFEPFFLMQPYVCLWDFVRHSLYRFHRQTRLRALNQCLFMFRYFRKHIIFRNTLRLVEQLRRRETIKFTKYFKIMSGNSRNCNNNSINFCLIEDKKK